MHVVEATAASLKQSPKDAGVAIALGYAHNAFMAAFEWYLLVQDARKFPGLAGERSRLVAFLQTCSYLKELLDIYFAHRDRIVSWLRVAEPEHASKTIAELDKLADKSKGGFYRRIAMLRDKLGFHWDCGFFAAQIRGYGDAPVRWSMSTSWKSKDLVFVPSHNALRSLLAPGPNEEASKEAFRQLVQPVAEAAQLVPEFVSTAVAGYLLGFKASRSTLTTDDVGFGARRPVRKRSRRDVTRTSND